MHSWVNHKPLSGWVALKYLSIETPAAKEAKKVDNFVPSITQVDLSVFGDIHRELSEKTEILQIDINSFKRSIARNE